MMKHLFVLLAIVAFGCSVKEDYVEGNRVQGLYERDHYDKMEYLCLKQDSTYDYFIEDSLLTKGTWDYTLHNGKSMIGLNDFNYSISLKKHTKYSGFSMPVKFSYAKSAVLLRMDADNHFKDFVRIDSVSCIVK